MTAIRKLIIVGWALAIVIACSRAPYTWDGHNALHASSTGGGRFRAPLWATVGPSSVPVSELAAAGPREGFIVVDSVQIDTKQLGVMLGGITLAAIVAFALASGSRPARADNPATT